MTRQLISKFLLLFIFQLVIFGSASAAIFDDENTLWKSGYNKFLLDDSDANRAENDHPVSLDENEIKNALLAIKVWEEGFFSKNQDAEPLFALTTVEYLAKYIAEGLRIAGPDQDIYFNVQTNKRKLVILKEKFVTSGRAFYKDGLLNIIIGDYQKPINDALEGVLDPGDTGNSQTIFSLDEAKRKGRTFGFNEELILIRGITNKEFEGDKRKDWLVFNLPVASEAYLADLREREEQLKGGGQKQLEREAALLAKQRREMRAEMARMRKQIDAMDSSDKTTSSSSSSSSTASLEKRIETLDALFEKGLISKEEYQAKRQEILNDI